MNLLFCPNAAPACDVIDAWTGGQLVRLNFIETGIR